MLSSSDSKTTPRFGSISSPSSFRPSYSGGTYRSIGIKRETSATPSYSSRWLNKEVTTKEPVETKKTSVKSVSSDTTKANDSKLSKTSQIGTSSSLLSKNKPKEVSSTSRQSVTLAKVRIRDANSTSSSYSAPKPRDPSPSEPAKDRYTSSSGYVSSSYSKLYPRSSSKLQVNNYNNRSSINSTSPAVSYLNGSDVGGRYRQNNENDDKLTKTSSEESSPTKETATTASTATTTTTTSSSDSSESEPNVEMIEVTVVTRPTSPNLCSTTTTNFSRCRRVEIAKTIEKTIKRPKRKPNTEDKEVQSDRMDDTSKYSRFSGRATSPWPSSYMDNKYSSMSYSRFNSGSSSTSMPKYSPTTKSEKESSETSPEKSAERSSEKSPSKSSRESSVSKSPSISRSNSIKSVTKSEKSKSKSPPVPTSSKSTSTSPSKSSKVYNNKTLPPQPPKLESPTKVISVSSSAASTTSSANATSSKWANKDFRKSALNVGQTDRPRKARTSSASTDNDECNKKSQQKPASNQISYTRSDRSPSVSSETSYSSGGNADDMTKNFMKLKISPPPTTTKHTTTPIETDDTAATSTLPVNSTEMMHLNSNMMTYDMKTQPNDAAVQINESSHSNDSCTKIDNTKSTIVNRVLAPVMNMFKGKTQHTAENQSGSDHDSAISTNDSIKPDTLVESVLNRTTTTISNGAKLVSSNNYLADESSWLNSTINEQTTDTQFDKFQSNQTINMKDQLQQHVDSGNQVSWWLQDTENDDTIADDMTLNQSDNETTQRHNSIDLVDSNQTTNLSIPWWMMDEATTTTSQSDPTQKYRITHIRSGERAWWLDEDTEESVNDILEAAENDNDNASKFTFKIKKIESGERAWWLCEEKQDSIVNQTMADDTIKEESNVDVDFWASINESLEADRIKEKERNAESKKQNKERFANNNYQYDVNANYIPLEARASPDGLEDYNNNNENRLSPYDNVDASNANVTTKFKKLFISKHQNIDEVLGAPCHALSPIRIDDDAPFEEILPSQVRIHDGTAKKLHIESERYGCDLLLSFNLLILSKTFNFRENCDYSVQSSQVQTAFRVSFTIFLLFHTNLISKIGSSSNGSKRRAQ